MAPSLQRLAGAVAFALLMVILTAFMAAPRADGAALLSSFGVALVVGYLLWPLLARAWRRHGSLQPTPARVLKVLAAAGMGTAALAGFKLLVLREDLTIGALLVSFLFVATFGYLGGAPRWQS